MMLVVLALLVVGVVLWIFSAPLAQWSRSAQPSDAVDFLGEHLLVVAMLGGCLVVLALIWLPKWQAARPDIPPKERFEVENNARKTLAEIVGGTALLVGLYFTWSSLEVSREGQITERFTKAIEQLGNNKLQIRLGGIYSLARIAGESEKDHWPIMEVLTAYVREHAPWPPKDRSPRSDHPCLQEDPAAAQEQPPLKLATDIQAVLTVLGQRDRTYEKDDQRLDLSGTDLHGANLGDARLEGANLVDACLVRASPVRAQLQGADLTGAQLQGANLGGAQLQGANLGGAKLQGANLGGAKLQGADLMGAQLQKANLASVQLQEANLMGAQLQEAHLVSAKLQGAQLQRANLTGARLQLVDLQGARLQGAFLGGAQLERANLASAYLGGARELTITQFSTVKTLYQAQLDPSFLEQIQQEYPQLLEKPRE